MRISDWSSDVCSSDLGKSGTAASVATMALLSGLGFLIHGTSAELAPGTPVQAYLAERLRFTWYPEAGAKMAIQQDRKSTRMTSSYECAPRMPTSAGEKQISKHTKSTTHKQRRT